MTYVGFDQQVLQLPPSVTHLYFGDGHKQELVDLPPTITSITLGPFSSISNFPPFLTHLNTLSNKNTFTVLRPLPPLPSSLTHLKCFAQTIPPISHLSKLEELHIIGDAIHCLPELPPSIKVLNVNTDSFRPIRFESFPPSLIEFKTVSAIPPVDNLPPLLAKLEFGHTFNQPVDNLPSSLTHIKLSKKFNQSVNKLPSSLTHLSLAHEFDQPVDHLPPSLTHLRIGRHFTHAIDHLPPSLTHLRIGNAFIKPIDHLPATLRHLHLGRRFNQTLSHLPPITHLSFEPKFNFSQERHPLPPSLTHACLGLSPKYVQLTSLPIKDTTKLPHLSHYLFYYSRRTRFNTCLQIPKHFNKFIFQVENSNEDSEYPEVTIQVDFETRLIHVSLIAALSSPLPSPLSPLPSPLYPSPSPSPSFF